MRGSFYGLAATPQRLRSARAGCRTPVKGLFVAGQDAWGSGVVGALAGGLMAANAVLKPRQLGTMWQAIRSGGVARDPATPWEGYLRVAGIEVLTPTVRRIRFEPLAGDTMPFAFAAGQYLKVDLPVAVEPIERSYSICSAPGESGFVEIAVKHEPDGLGSGFLHEELEAGLALRVSGPHGAFTWEPGPVEGTADTLLLIAGGVGITPLMSVLLAAADAGHPGRIVLLASFRTQDEVLFGPEIEALRSRLPGLEVSVFVTDRKRRIGLDELLPYAGRGDPHPPGDGRHGVGTRYGLPDGRGDGGRGGS
ncbi:FAD-binding oxidoreductase, partial [Streptomyces sp. NPDC005921]